MEAKKTNCRFHVVGYKYTGRFDQYEKLVGQAFQELKSKLDKIPSRTDTTVALYEPKRGSEHIEGYFYVGVVVDEKPEKLPDGSEHIYVEGTYAGAIGQIKNMGKIYDFVGRWIRDNGYKQIWPDTLFVERYEFPIPRDQLTLEEKVEVLLPIVE